ncbi:MAG: TRAP transporter small permease [Hyphomicrobiales bacterium]|nr:TRAP transporter small permease [Hyphomicrobiales bacterium]MCP5000173.1 TRAP transporter small permease [Hyphomicrobiales bacterium]
MDGFVRIADWLSELTGRIAAWIFFAIGFIITYEVVMRYVFVAPTIWVDEMARIGQIWAAYLAAAFTLKHREMVVIDIAFKTPGTLGRRLTETFSLCVIGLFCFVTVYYGFELWLRATLRGHTTDTYLALPRWFTDASIWVGFGVLALQVVAELIRLWRPASNETAPGRTGP